MMGTKAYNGAAAKRNTLLTAAVLVMAVLGFALITVGVFRQFHGGVQHTAHYSDGALQVMASYSDKAGIPAEAELRASLITPEQDPNHYAQRTSGALAALGMPSAAPDVTAQLLQIGFYLPDGTACEPQTPVALSVRLPDGSLPEGAALRVVHFGADGAEALEDAAVDENGNAAFTTASFSEFSIMLLDSEFAIMLLEDEQPRAPGDLTAFVSDVVIKDNKGNKVEDGTLYVGEEYSIHLEFKEKGAQDLQFDWTDEGTMTYQIPKKFKVTPQYDKELKVMIGGEEIQIGTYSIDANGLLTIHLTDEGKQALDSSGNVGLTFDMWATAQPVEGGSDVDVHFGDTGEDFTFKITDQPKIAVDKTSHYDDDEHILSYTVSTKVEHGPIEDLVVRDTLTPPQSKGITLKMIDGADGKPDIKVTVIRGGKTIELTEKDYELVPITPDPNNPHAPQIFEVKLKENSNYNPLKTDDELQVTYKYQAAFDQSAADVYWGQVVNEAAVTGAMPMKDPASEEEKPVTVEEKRNSYAEVYWDTDGKGVVSKGEDYSEATGMLHYTLYAAAAAGGYTPFFIQDRATVEYDGRTWIVQGFDTDHFKNLKVYAQDVDQWDDLDQNGLPKPGAGGKQELKGYEYYNDYMSSSGSPAGYSAASMDNYVYWMFSNDNLTATDLYIFFGMDKDHSQGHWRYNKGRLMTVEYDLDVSNGLTLYDEDTGEAVTLTKEEVLLAGIKNTVHLRYGHFNPGYSVFFSNGEKLNKYGSLDKVNNTIDYTVSLNLADTTVWNYMKEVAGDPSDPTDGILSAEFFDEYDNSWNYVDDSLRATLYMKNGQHITFSYYPDVLKWQSLGTADDFGDGDIHALLCAFHCAKEDNTIGPWELYLPNVFDADYDSLVDRLEFTYTLKASDEWLKVHAYDDTVTNVHNAAQIVDAATTHWDAAADVPYFPARLTKTAAQEGTSNLLHFTLEVNSAGADLDPAKEYLIVTDESTGIQIKPDSIQVTDKEGNPLAGLGNTTLDAALTPDQWGMLPAEKEHQYKLKVPDSKTLHITYDALITEMGDNVAVSNKASIDGVDRTDSNYDGSLKVDEVYAGGDGDTYELTVEKQDSANISKKLSGAKFKFYIVRNTDSTLGHTDTIQIGDKEYDCHTESGWEFTTGDDGRFKITKDMNWSLEPGNYYILKETEAPAGYKLLEGPILFYYGLKPAGEAVTYPVVPPNGVFTVQNDMTAFRLPKTGGPGTQVYVLTGLALMLLAAAMLAGAKRLHRSDES